MSTRGVSGPASEGAAPASRGYRARMAGRDDEAIATAFVKHVSGGPPTESEKDLLAQAFEAVRLTEADG